MPLPLGGCKGRNSRHVVSYELENFLFPYFRRSPEAASVQITGQCEAGCWAAEVGARRGTVPPRPRVARPAFLPALCRPPPCLGSREPLPFSQCHGDSRSRKQASGNIKLPVSCPRGRRPRCWTRCCCAAGQVPHQLVPLENLSVKQKAKFHYVCVVAAAASLQRQHHYRHDIIVVIFSASGRTKATHQDTFPACPSGLRSFPALYTGRE